MIHPSAVRAVGEFLEDCCHKYGKLRSKVGSVLNCLKRRNDSDKPNHTTELTREEIRTITEMGPAANDFTSPVQTETEDREAK
jgi:hypothetical protein